VEQHAALPVHAAAMDRHEVGGGWQTPAVHWLLQQAPFVAHAPPLAVQGVLQTCAEGSQIP
jgi:hypothetical protein